MFVEGLGGGLPAEGFAGSTVQSCGDSVQVAKPGSSPPWAAEETRMTMPSPSRSSPPWKPNSSTDTPTTHTYRCP